MTFIDFFKQVFGLLGTGGALLIAVVVFLVALGNNAKRRDEIYHGNQSFTNL